ncbi:MAG: polyprenol monophosphomannose synthase [Nitrospinae bacterium]|nr:polyprenol monophosphomannose synthase [Nitrospinota bacterium]
MDQKVLIIIPTYNEAENVEKLAGAIHSHVPSARILVVDDNSPDGTAVIVEKMKELDPEKMDILRRPGKMGLGSAYIAGFKYALARDFDVVFEMDADFSHNPAYLPKFLEEIKRADLVLGSRYVEGGGVENWPLLRKMISIGGSVYSRTILNIPIHDVTGGFKCFRRRTLEAIDLDAVRSEGYSFQIELTYRVHKKGLKIKEIPIVFTDRVGGKSKMSWKIFLEAIFRVWQIRFTAQ